MHGKTCKHALKECLLVTIMLSMKMLSIIIFYRILGIAEQNEDL